jgi:chromosome segregation protein
VREDESSCGVDGLSEGTRDQLYLSLRLAAVERHVEAAEPMPFLADDLFVTTDEARLEKGLAALAELGDRTQVILFTHHRHVAETARRLPGARVQSLADPLQAAIADAADQALVSFPARTSTDARD